MVATIPEDIIDTKRYAEILGKVNKIVFPWRPINIPQHITFLNCVKALSEINIKEIKVQRYVKVDNLEKLMRCTDILKITWPYDFYRDEREHYNRFIIKNKEKIILKMTNVEYLEEEYDELKELISLQINAKFITSDYESFKILTKEREESTNIVNPERYIMNSISQKYDALTTFSKKKKSRNGLQS